MAQSHHSHRPALSPRLVFGAVLAPLAAALGLAGLGLFGLGDAQLAARTQLEQEARVRLQSVQSQWERCLSSAKPLAVAVASRLLPESSAWSLSAGPTGAAAPESEDAPTVRLHILGARSDINAGEYARAMAQCRKAIAIGPALAGEALVVFAQSARLAGAFAPGTRFSAACATVPYHALYQGTSARLLALLTAAPLLDLAELEDASASLRTALASGRVALPLPAEDTALPTGDGWEFHGDPWWSALEDECRARLCVGPGADPAADPATDPAAWRSAFDVEAREAMAVRRQIEAEYPAALTASKTSGWTLHGNGAERLAARAAPGNKIQVVRHRATELDKALQSLLPEGDGYRISAFHAPSTASLAEPVPLAGVATQLHIEHTSESDVLKGFSFRWRALRGGLLGVAALLCLAAFAAWRALVRDARLRDLRSTFVASVSHDLRTPVAAIGLLASNMAQGYAAGSEEKYLDSIQGETARLRRLVDDLLDFGRIERGLPPRIQRAEVELLPWIEAFTERERKRCYGYGCSLDLVTEALPRHASLDAAALERGLANLIDNAIKHGRATTVTLAVRGTGTTLTFEVEDSGVGLGASALRADLFQPFERGSARTAGTGLGLSIVRAIAEGHGGQATLRAGASGAGAIATIELPTDGSQAA